MAHIFQGLLGYEWYPHGPPWVSDWTVQPYSGDPQHVASERQAETLQSGDLVRVFKSVSDGDVCWSGAVALDYGCPDVMGYRVHGAQAGIAPENWGSMFFNTLPARLEQDGRTIYGALEAFAETGTEGVLWAVHEYGAAGYDGLHILKDGDMLTIYSAVRDGAVAWEGTLDLKAVPPQEAELPGMDTAPEGIDRREWLNMALNSQPVIVQRPAPQP